MTPPPPENLRRRFAALPYVVQRIVLAVPTFFGITIITFAVVHLAPGDPADRLAETASEQVVSAEQYEQMRAYWGLDRPIVTQYVSWLGRFVTLDFGRSFFDHRPVREKIAERLPRTAAVSTVSIALALLIAVPVGALSAWRRNGWFDRLAGGSMLAVYSIPNYVAAMLLVALVLGLGIKWLPIAGARSDEFDQLAMLGRIWDVVRHAILITVCYTYPMIAFQARFVRGNLSDVLKQDFIRTARAKGVDSLHIITRHGLRNTLIPLITLLGLLLPTVVSGTVILESIFNWPGIGRLFYDAVTQRDYPTVMALSAITAWLVLLATLLADLAYARVDPRVRAGQG